MIFPEELQYKIISYVPYLNYINVCKNWNSRIKELQKNYSNIIGSWYKLKIVTMNWKNTRDAARFLIAKRSLGYLQHIPESIVLTLGFPLCYITLLPALKVRKKSDIRDWIINVQLHPRDLMYFLSL